MDWIIAAAVSLAILIFVLVLTPWKKVRDYFCYDRKSKLDEDGLDGWGDESVGLYHELIRHEYETYTHNENEINQRSTSLLAVEGVVLALMVAFLDPQIESVLMASLFIISIAFMFTSAIFVIWAIRPQKRDVIQEDSHQKNYHWYRTDPDRLHNVILYELLITLESLKGVYKTKVRRFEFALYFFVVSMIALVIMFCSHVFT